MGRIQILTCSFCLLILSGCSAFMAATVPDAPNTGIVRRGATRAEVEAQLGKPMKFLRQSWGDVATYQYITDDVANYKRAALYGVLTVATMGVSEFFTFPVEALQGRRHVVVVTYAPGGRVIDVKETVYEAPLPKPETVIDTQTDDRTKL